MKCPFCSHLESKVVDSRPADEGASIRRRRECLSCHKRFTTYETMESLPLVVVKKDGSRQSFDRNKVMAGLIRACEKRPVPYKMCIRDSLSPLEPPRGETKFRTKFFAKLSFKKACGGRPHSRQQRRQPPHRERPK